ncbi:hypothetical protein Pmani_022455, partial [Petrolisthes manimaculis]
YQWVSSAWVRARRLWVRVTWQSSVGEEFRLVNSPVSEPQTTSLYLIICASTSSLHPASKGNSEKLICIKFAKQPDHTSSSGGGGGGKPQSTTLHSLLHHSNYLLHFYFLPLIAFHST